MKQLIKYVLFVSLISGFLSIMFYLNLFSLEKTKKTYVNKTMNYILQDNEYNDILFVGSSRVWVHIDPMAIAKKTYLSCYNLACDGSGLVEHRAMIFRYLRSHPAPKVIFINLDFLCFDVDHEAYNFPEYFPFLGDSVFSKYLKPYNSKYRSLVKQYFYTYKWLSSADDGDKLASLFSPYYFANDPDKLYKGYKPVSKKWDKEAEVKLKIRFTAKIPDEGVKIFEDIVSLCKNENIRIVGLIAPFQSNYQKVVTNADWAMKKIQAICNNNEVELWNYSNMPISSSKQYFYNSTHLNLKGAAIYTDSLASRIQKLWINQ